MPRIIIFCLFAAAMSVWSYGEAPTTAGRDKALKRIDVCLRHREVSTRECNHLKQDVATLVKVYRAGDKPVLPTLFRFAGLTDFYDEALLSDPDGFLTALAQSSKAERDAVARAMAGGMLRLRDGERFKAIRTLLAGIPDSSPTKEVAGICLKILETNNASWLVSYFPPQTFTGRAADFTISRFSRSMYALGERPLWTPSSANEETYRLTYLPSSGNSKQITVSVLSDGTASVTMILLDNSENQITSRPPATVSQHQVSEFLKHLDRAHFWEMSTELPPDPRHLHLDEVEWILEGVQNGRYHVALRACHDSHNHVPADKAFAEAARFLFQLAATNIADSADPSPIFPCPA